MGVVWHGLILPDLAEIFYGLLLGQQTSKKIVHSLKFQIVQKHEILIFGGSGETLGAVRHVLILSDRAKIFCGLVLGQMSYIQGVHICKFKNS